MKRSSPLVRGLPRLTFYLSVIGILATACSAWAEDPIRDLQTEAILKGSAPWGHWGAVRAKYSTHSTHSNRLVPIYVFGDTLEPYCGDQSIYRDEEKLRTLYGASPEGTHNPEAEYCDQTDLFRLQEKALADGKKYVVLIVFDGLDWHTTRAAAVHASGKVAYQEGRGQGLAFQDYRGTTTDFGFCVTAPHNKGAKVDVDAQTVSDPGNIMRGGYNVSLAGETPWSVPRSSVYLLGKSDSPGGVAHPYVDSAASATAMTSGAKTYNEAINVDDRGRRLKTIAMIAQEKGFKIGAVSSVPISHATPAASYAHNVIRHDYQDISRDLLGLPSVSHREPMRGLDVLIGTGWGNDKKKAKRQGANFVPGNIYLSKHDLKSIDADDGGKYQVALRTSGKSGIGVLNKAATAAVDKNQRLFGMFGTRYDHLPFRTADGRYNPTASVRKKAEAYESADLFENPTLADMTTTALKVLSHGDAGFWLMIEPGDVDWACHANNIDDAIGAIHSGEEAFRVVIKWIEKNNAWKDSLVIVTSDHGHYFVLRDPTAFASR